MNPKTAFRTAMACLARSCERYLENAPPSEGARASLGFLRTLAGTTATASEPSTIGSLFELGCELIPAEVEAAATSSAQVREALAALEETVNKNPETLPNAALTESFWRLFTPTAVGVADQWEARVEELRQLRSVEITSANADPINDTATQVLFTANALLTVPFADADLSALEHIGPRLQTVRDEPQQFWYDHPIPIGVPPDQNELLYGLRGLSDALRFERDRGAAPATHRLPVVVSASVTHPGLAPLARDYLAAELERAPDIAGLDIHLFTETETRRLVADVLVAATTNAGIEVDRDVLNEVFGVDGAYGRHFTFLKAIAPLWQLAIDTDIKATFKIDLDQVFPQNILVSDTGCSAFELLASRFWGAQGVDGDGRPVELGLAAGALVNQKDIHRGLFTPDVALPEHPQPPERWVFASRVPQALSTVAEMMVPGSQEESHCLSRIHVTGGTSGARVDALRRFRPFSPSFFGRAEDQAFLMSALSRPTSPQLAYTHLGGLIMRHDKEAFAQEAMRAAVAGKLVGDLERIVLFSLYGATFPDGVGTAQRDLAPFTGSFVTPLPVSTALLTLALHVVSLAAQETAKRSVAPEKPLRVADKRLLPLLERTSREPDWMAKKIEAERAAWEAFYDALDWLESSAREGLPEATALTQRIQSIIAGTRIAAR